MDKDLSRRHFMGSVVGLAGMAVLPSVSLFSGRQRLTAEADPAWPLPYVALDPKPVMVLAHDSFFVGGCAYGAFHAFIKIMREQVGDPFTAIPTQMLKFGKGGVIETGTLCGSLTGTLAAVNLVSTKWDQISKELIHWYAQTYLPTDVTNQMAVDHDFNTIKYEGALVQSLSGSPLCHVSVTRWCDLTKATVTSDHRKERCGRVTADTIGKAIELLNLDLQGQYAPTFKATESTEKCLSCHGPKSEMANVQAEMTCGQCHGNPHAE